MLRMKNCRHHDCGSSKRIKNHSHFCCGGIAMTNRIERKFIGKSQAVLVAFVAIVGCSNPVANIPELKPEQLVAKPVQQPAYEQNYKMVPYDLITIRFPFHPEQDPKAPVSIRPDAHLSLDGVGSAQAAGLTPA